MTTRFSNAVLGRAIEILGAQSMVPKSPAALDANGRACLCLAAALAKAGMLERGLLSDSEQLEHALVQSGSKETLADAFSSLGWSPKTCRARLELNDAIPDSMRRERVIEHLRQELAAQREV